MDGINELTGSQSASDGRPSATDVPVNTSAPTATTGQEPQVGQTPASGGAEMTQDGPSGPFYSADKVPAPLQEDYRLMQADYTRKTQEIAAVRQSVEFFGGPEALNDLASAFQSREGMENLLLDIAEALGHDADKLSQALGMNGQQAPGQQMQPPTQAPQPQYVTKEDLAALQKEWQERQQLEADLAEIDDIFDKMQVPEPARELVAFYASKLPPHLGYAKRIEEGFKQYQAAVASQTAQTQPATPTPLSGATPMGENPKSPTDFDEATKAAMEYVRGI